MKNIRIAGNGKRSEKRGHPVKKGKRRRPSKKAISWSADGSCWK